MKTFVIGDLHGNYKGLKQCLERSGFDYEKDTLITLGDICDGYSEVYEVVEELLRIDNRIDIKGNHDEPFLEFIEKGIHPWTWNQGGVGTLKSYGKLLGDKFKFDYTPAGAWGEPENYKSNLNSGDIPLSHKEFFRHQIPYYIDDKNRCFVHGGFNRHSYIKTQMHYTLWWDRDLWMAARSFKDMPEKGDNVVGHKYKFKMKDEFSEVFIGHTSTVNWNTTLPMKAANIWNLDTGGGFAGKVTIMDVDTHEFWQSDISTELYPDDFGRRKK
jgi:serine/threonine protein phosphatase 1